MEGMVGYGFRPTEDELVGYYLYNKIQGNTRVEEAIDEVNICSFDPRDLRFQSKYKSRDAMWYFFSKIENKYKNGNQQKRTTTSGFWKVTGVPVDVMDQCGTWCATAGKKIGQKRVLSFPKERSSEKSKSDWVMHEFHCHLLPEHERTYVICRLIYKGNDRSILLANATDPTPKFVPAITNSAGSEVNQSRQENSGNNYSEYDSANHGHHFGGNFDMQVEEYPGSFNPLPEYDSPNHDQWLRDYFNLQQQVPYSAPNDENSEIIRNFLIEEMREKTCMQQNYSDYRPKKPDTGYFSGDSSDSETGSMIFEDTSSSTDSVGSSYEPCHTPIDDIPSLSTIEPLPKHERHEQPKQLKLHLQSKKRVINTQKSECEWKMAEDSIKKTPSTNTVKQNWIVLGEISQRNSQWNYLKNVIIGFLLFISIIGWIILVG